MRLCLAIAVMLVAGSVDAAHAQGRCRSPNTPIQTGFVNEKAVFYASGTTCTESIRIAAKYEVESARVVTQGRLGRAGVSVIRNRQGDGRTLFVMAYEGRTPGQDVVVVRYVTREIATGARASTDLKFNITLN